MRTIRLGRTGAEVSAVAAGTWSHGGPVTVGGHQVGWSGHDDRLAGESLVTAWEHGIDHWDTADVYGDGRAERLIGGLWKRVPRDEIFIASKVGWAPGPFGRFYHPELVRSRVERSLANLRTDRIDLYYLHHCDFGPQGRYLDGALEVLQRCREEGKIRFLGLSDWDPGKILGYVEQVDPDVVQPYRNLLDDTYQTSGLGAWVTEHDLGVAFFSPLKHGLLFGKYDAPPTFPDGDMRNDIEGFRDAALLARLRRCRDEVGRRFASHPQPVLHALIGGVLSDSPTGCALLGMRNPEQATAAAAVGERLSDDDLEWVRTLYAGD